MDVVDADVDVFVDVIVFVCDVGAVFFRRACVFAGLSFVCYLVSIFLYDGVCGNFGYASAALRLEPLLLELHTEHPVVLDKASWKVLIFPKGRHVAHLASSEAPGD